MMQSRDMNAPITVFLVDGAPIGTCPAGQEAQWLKSLQEHGNAPTNISQRRSTEGRWDAYARAQGRGASKAEAVSYL